jgi:hypothetical protein
MPTILWGPPRHDDHMPEPRLDLVVATGTAIRLDRFVRLHPAHVDPVIDVVGELLVSHGVCAS